MKESIRVRILMRDQHEEPALLYKTRQITSDASWKPVLLLPNVRIAEKRATSILVSRETNKAGYRKAVRIIPVLSASVNKAN